MIYDATVYRIFYADRLINQELLSSGIEVTGTSPSGIYNDLAIPIGGSRKVGFLCDVSDRDLAEQLLIQIKGKPGFPNARIIINKYGYTNFKSYMVAWGEPMNEAWTSRELGINLGYREEILF